MSNTETDNIHRQDGGLPSLRLAEVDPRLARQNKSIEDLSDPRFRLVVLWTTIGQYRFSAEKDGETEGGTSVVVNDARYYQLLATWTQESRRVDPRLRFEVESGGVYGNVTKLIEENRIVEAYDEIIDVRNTMPELLHPDIRFNLLERIRQQSATHSAGDLLEEMIVRDMIDETVPGGASFCDNPERLRRYLVLSKIDSKFIALIDDYLASINSNEQAINQTDYFDNIPESIRSICDAVVERGYDDLAGFLFTGSHLDIDSELMLLPMISSL